MKVELERKLTACPEQLHCVVCQSRFPSPRIRNILYNDRGLIQGDICPSCLKLKPQEIKQSLLQQSQQLMKKATLIGGSAAIDSFKQALERQELAQEDLKLPTRYARGLKWLEVLSQETQELEAARLGMSNCRCGKRSRLRIIFTDEHPFDHC